MFMQLNNDTVMMCFVYILFTSTKCEGRWTFKHAVMIVDFGICMYIYLILFFI